MFNNEKGGSEIGILNILGIIFVTLKLLGKIDWSWWYVTMPFWGGLVVLILLVLIAVIFGSNKSKFQIGGRNNRQF